MASIHYWMLINYWLGLVCATDMLITGNAFRKIAHNDVGLQIVSGDVFKARSVLECSVQCLQSRYTAFIYDKSSLICRPGVSTDPMGTKPLPGQSMYVADWLDASKSTQIVTATNPMDTTWVLGRNATTVGQPSYSTTEPSNRTTEPSYITTDQTDSTKDQSYITTEQTDSTTDQSYITTDQTDSTTEPSDSATNLSDGITASPDSTLKPSDSSTDASESTTESTDITSVQELISNIPIETSTTTTTSAQIACDTSLGYRVTTYNTAKACLFVSKFTLAYFIAETNCTGLHGRLTTMKSLEKRDLIVKAILEAASNQTKFWVGLKLFSGLIWSDGQSLTDEETTLKFYVPPTCGMTTSCGCYAYNTTLDSLSGQSYNKNFPLICEYVP